MATAAENRVTDHQAGGARIYSHQPSAKHFQESAEFLPLRNCALGALAVSVLSIALARRAAATSLRRRAPPLGEREAAERAHEEYERARRRMTEMYDPLRTTRECKK